MFSGGLIQTSLRLRRRLAIEMADTSTAIHAAGVNHRNFKPSNIFLRKRGANAQDITQTDPLALALEVVYGAESTFDWSGAMRPNSTQPSCIVV
jgi:serine/threonine protein kinase